MSARTQAQKDMQDTIARGREDDLIRPQYCGLVDTWNIKNKHVFNPMSQKLNKLLTFL